LYDWKKGTVTNDIKCPSLLYRKLIDISFAGKGGSPLLSALTRSITLQECSKGISTVFKEYNSSLLLEEVNGTNTKKGAYIIQMCELKNKDDDIVKTLVSAVLDENLRKYATASLATISPEIIIQAIDQLPKNYHQTTTQSSERVEKIFQNFKELTNVDLCVQEMKKLEYHDMSDPKIIEFIVENADFDGAAHITSTAYILARKIPQIRDLIEPKLEKMITEEINQFWDESVKKEVITTIGFFHFVRFQDEVSNLLTHKHQ